MGNFCVWDTLTGDVSNLLEGHTGPVWSVAFSSDGTRIVSGSDDKSVRVWNMSTEPQVPRYLREKLTSSSTRSQGHSGWLLSQDDEEYLMFVPPGERLPDDTCILTIPRNSIAHVDFTGSQLGIQWHDCYSP